jgi:hypothetical protein
VECLAEAADPTFDEARIRTLSAFVRAAQSLVHDPAFMSLVKPPDELGVTPDGRLFAGSEVTITLTRLHQLDGYLLGSRQICVGRLEWQMTFELGTLEKSGLGHVRRMLPVECRVIGLVWLAEGADLAEPVAEIAQVVSADASGA